MNLLVFIFLLILLKIENDNIKETENRRTNETSNQNNSTSTERMLDNLVANLDQKDLAYLHNKLTKPIIQNKKIPYTKMKKYKQIESRSNLKTFAKIISGDESQSLLLDSLSTVRCQIKGDQLPPCQTAVLLILINIESF